MYNKSRMGKPIRQLFKFSLCGRKEQIATFFSFGERLDL